MFPKPCEASGIKEGLSNKLASKCMYSVHYFCKEYWSALDAEEMNSWEPPNPCFLFWMSVWDWYILRCSSSCTCFQSQSHTCSQNTPTHIHACSHALNAVTRCLSCRMCLAMPQRASACLARRATANPICCSAMPPTTCREFWVVTPLGWAPVTPPFCRPSSVRVRVMMSAYSPMCTIGFYVGLLMRSGWLSGWISVFCFFFFGVWLCMLWVCASTAAALITAVSHKQVSADGRGGRYPVHPILLSAC